MTPALTILIGLMAIYRPVIQPLTFEQRWEPVKQLQDRAPLPQERELTFEERWEPVKDMPPMIDMSQTRKVRTFSIVPDLPKEITAEPAAEPPPLPLKTRTTSLDVCRRHGMVKQITQGGRSWRCRK